MSNDLKPHSMLAWHFTGDTLRDGQPVPAIGEKLIHPGAVVLSNSGLHGSEHPFDALQYAPGKWLHRTSHTGEILCGYNKLASSERIIMATIDAEALLRSFARQCALDVIHLWDAPGIVWQYLETGDEGLRAVARAVAWDAAQNEAGAAAWAATHSTAQTAARETEQHAAQAAVQAVERYAERYVERYAAWAAMPDTARYATRSAAQAAARYAAWTAARAKQRERFARMVHAEFAGALKCSPEEGK